MNAPHSPHRLTEPVADGCGPQSPPLEAVLRTGPFHAALRAAVERRGLSLGRLESRLRRQGTPVTAATISAWQSGKYRPERPHALAALAALETILELHPGDLVALLKPPKPRGRWQHSSHRRPSLSAAWAGRLDPLLHSVDAAWSRHLTSLSSQHRMHCDAEGRVHRMWDRLVLRAEEDGPDRYVLGYTADHPSPPPVLRPVTPQRLGPSVADADEGTLLATLLFERPLARGETVIIEYTTEHTHDRPRAEQSLLHLQGPVRDCVLEVCFDPAAVPTRCRSFHSLPTHDGLSPEATTEQPLRIGPGLRAHTVGLDLPPSDFGIRWDW
ncbi:transcriptional regulator [Streptomyces sp. NA04227]|uniref:transcriptional regulator n=1 Tax=Streptomyces sp. NA04227 TaxID=2742136 RepID=UPI0015903CE8|nr:transcriptional regulator [Streptomyces sp. NA04227]QKW06520.1 transcriptional regulator [Streptomyces sp. NA04227]